MLENVEPCTNETPDPGCDTLTLNNIETNTSLSDYKRMISVLDVFYSFQKL